MPGEYSTFQDEDTRVLVHQVTNHPSINHPTYFLQSSFTPGDRTLVFTSYRTGSPQLFEAPFPGGEPRQLTRGAPVHPFSAAIRDERTFFVRGGSVWVLNRKTGCESLIIDFPGAQLGETSPDPNGEWITAAIKQGGRHGIATGRADGGGWHVIPFERTVIHPQFHLLEPEWLIFAGDPAPRMHRVRRDGTGLECLYQHGNDEFVVHETFLGATGDIVYVVWPFALRRMNWHTRRMTIICECNAWHIASNRAGTKVLCDTNHPDRGLFLIDVATGALQKVCRSDSSNQGSQWRRSAYALAGDFAAARKDNLSWMETATDTIYGPQWTHPHPSFSQTESRIAFASDRTGHPQVYVAELPQ